MSDIRPVLTRDYNPVLNKPDPGWRGKLTQYGNRLKYAFISNFYGPGRKSRRLILLQMAGAFSVLFGVSFWSIPVAFVLGGIAAIVVAERQ